MSNTTYFLDKPAGSAETTQLAQIQKTVDFTKLAVANAGTADVLNVKAGTMVHAIWMRTDTVNTGSTSAEIALAFVTNSGGPSLASAVLGTANSTRFSDRDATRTAMYFAADDTLRLTAGGTGNLDAAKVTIGMIYSLPAPASAV